MTFERSMLTVALLATVAFAAAGLHAWAAPPAEDLGRHVLLGLGSSMLVVFPHLWVLVYLLGTGRAVRREVAEHGAPETALARARRLLLLALPPLALAVAGAVATVLLGPPVVTGVLEPRVHAVAFAAALGAQAWALLAERRALRDNAALLAELDTAPA